MNKEHNNENKNDEEDTLTLAKLFSNWYVGAVVGFALGTLLLLTMTVQQKRQSSFSQKCKIRS